MRIRHGVPLLLLFSLPAAAQVRTIVGVGAARDLGRDWGSAQVNVTTDVAVQLWRGGASNLDLQLGVTAQRRHIALAGLCAPACDFPAPRSARVGYGVGPAVGQLLSPALRGTVWLSIGQMRNLTRRTPQFRSPPTEWSLRHRFVAVAPSLEWSLGRWRLGARWQVGRLTARPDTYFTGICEVAGPPHVGPDLGPCLTHVPTRYWRSAHLTITR